jgi:hypothetical protein
MKIEYLLQLKKEPAGKNLNVEARVRNALKSCFFCVTSKSFLAFEENKESQIEYSFAEHKIEKEGTIALLIYLTLFLEGNITMKSVGFIDQADSRFMSNVNLGDSKFHITRLYDDRSIYFCIKAYPYFCRLESKLRCLILKLLTKTFGNLWAKETLSQEIRMSLIQRIKSDQVEKMASEAIYEMDYSVLKSFLFEPYRTIESNEIIDLLLSENAYQAKTTEEIGEILRKGALKSNWDRYFVDVHFDNLDETLTSISIQRNKIAHSKYYSADDYSSDSIALKEFIKQVDVAIGAIEVKSIMADDAAATLSSFLLLDYPGLKTMAKSLMEVIQQNMPDIKQLSRNFSTIFAAIISDNLKESSWNLASTLLEAIPKARESELPPEQPIADSPNTTDIEISEEERNSTLDNNEKSED